VNAQKYQVIQDGDAPSMTFGKQLENNQTINGNQNGRPPAVFVET
jgi:hypothetical protein